MNAHTKIKPVSRADQIVEQISANIRAFNASPRQGFNPLDFHRDALEEDMSWQACTSPAAAILKLALLESEASCALSWLKDEWKQNKTELYIARQVGTVIRWLEREFGVSVDTIREYYHSDACERKAWDYEHTDDSVVLP